jgi:DNA-binding MarR family transcriptional regulator/GNAT superfamily N-acetyltransferase
MEHVKSLGLLALTSRLKLLVDYFTDEVETIYNAHGLNFKPKWFTLFSLVAKTPNLTLTDAAVQIGQTHASVHHNAAEMAEAGILKITRSKEDERRKLLTLTKDGIALHEKLLPVWEKMRFRLDEIDASCAHRIIPTIESLERTLSQKPLRKEIVPVNLSGLVIRPYENRDLKAFGALNEAWLREYFYIEPEDVQVLGDPYTHIFKPGGEIWVAEIDGKTVGCCALLQHKDGSLELAKMAVDKLAQGYGVGQKLAERIIAQSKDRDADKLYIITNTKLASAMKLYRRLGFIDSKIPKHTRYARGNITLELLLASCAAGTDIR